MIRTVVILGAGNVAYHLTRALLQNTVDVRQIYNRTLEKAKEIGETTNIKYTDKISELEKADLYIIASSDDAIEEISYHIPFNNTLVVHTSGSQPMSILKGDYRKGVFYPMQTFSKEAYLQYDEIPFFVEAQNENDLEDLYQLGKRVSGKAYKIDSAKRLKMHISAVMVNNFTNHLYTLAADLCEKNEIPFEVFHPLIIETTEKIMKIPPYKAQTGPARRGDERVVHTHLENIENDNVREIYRLLSQSITKMYND